ncbi:hypothetical protein [Spirulina major]|uniref:hypothetical protein n=1 Tax=Spirulina major TaxID=270636 RepID=UPI001114A185|nr:hypothetical protein [Spirulina major]
MTAEPTFHSFSAVVTIPLLYQTHIILTHYHSTLGGTVNDIMGHTLFLLMAAIQTENFTAVLDSCFSGGATRDITVRSRDVTEKITITPQEKAYQEDWLARLDWNQDQFVQRYRRGIAKGVVLAATQRHQLAIDEQLPGFIAGAFSYRLTQHLWQTESNAQGAIARISEIIPPGYRQQPLWEAKPGTQNETAPMFFVNQPNPAANAVVVNIAQGQATLLLVGIAPTEVTVGKVLSALNRGAQVRITERQGLVAMGQVQGRLQMGDVLRSA